MEEHPFATSARGNSHHYEDRHTLQDSQVSGDEDHGGSGENGGALDALWRFEARHHFLLNNTLGTAHTAFVDDLYDALDHARVSLEQQSARVLAVLHDKDVRIQELENELREAKTPSETRDCGVQVAIQKLRGKAKDQAVQCRVEDGGTEALRRRVDEQDEQIEVLLDELERIQRVLADKQAADDQDQSKMAANDQERHLEASSGVATVSQSTQTQDETAEASQFNVEDALAAIAALQMQLEMVERRNTELMKADRERRVSVKKDEAALSVDAVERQLRDAIRTMESSTASQCTATTMLLAPVASKDKMSCVELEHKLELALVEREQLMDQVLALRAELCQPRGVSGALTSTARTRSSGGECSQVTCQHGLRRVLQLVKDAHKKQQPHIAETTKLLKKELRRALRDREDDADIATVVARVTQEWMQWEAAHVKEIELLRHQRRQDMAVLTSRSGHLVDEVHRLSQLNVDLQTELKVAKSPTHTRDVATVSAIDTNHRVLVLDQSLQGLREQLDIARRAIQALSAGGDGSHIRAVHFVDSSSTPSEQLAITRVSNMYDWKRQIQELSEELIAVKSQHFKRLQPVNTSEQAVVEYFRLEREALRLRNRLKEKDDHIQQLEIHREQLEKSIIDLHARSDEQELTRALQRESSAASSHTVQFERQRVERLYLRHLQTQNSELRAELMKGRSRVIHLERELSKHRDLGEDDSKDGAQVRQSLVSKVDEHHSQAVQSFSFWQASVRRHDQELTRNESTISHAYAILLVHYEALATQLHLLRDSNERDSTPCHAEDISGFSDLPTRWRLIQKIHVLQDRLVEAQLCRSCGKHVDRIPVEQVDEGTSTSQAEARGVSTQTSARDHRRAQQSKGVQVSFKSLQTEGSSLRMVASTSSTRDDSLMPLPSYDSAEMAGDSLLQDIHRQLEASLARINELTAREQKLKERLDEAQKANKKHAKDREKLLCQVDEMSSSNASLSSRLQEYERVMEDQKLEKSHRKEASGEGDTSDALARAHQQLSLREQENVELVRQLCETKEKWFQQERLREDAERKADQLSATLEAHHASREEEKNAHLELYMNKVNQSLEAIERDKQRLTIENQQLHQRLNEVELERAKKEAQGTRSCGTETDTDPAFDLERLLALPAYQELQTRVILLSKELADQHAECEKIRATLEAEKLEKSRGVEEQLHSIEREKLEFGQLADDLKTAHECLQQEFAEYQEMSVEAKAEADKRIEFLTKCVEECSRLVDSAAPGDEIVTVRDIYDTIISVSKRVVAGEARTGGVGPVKRKGTPKNSSGSRVPEAGASDVSALAQTTRRDAQSSAAVFHSQLQAETWRVRSAKLEASLRAASLKNKTFEDMVDHLELEMENLREEVKERMSKESLLLNKQGQMKVEVANLKAQNTTLTSRLAEACGELKRIQDAVKTSDGETVRLRSALQRKTDLLTRLKAKVDETQQALDNSVKRIAQLESAEKTLASTQMKAKDQIQQLQELRQQCLVYRDANTELNGQVQTCKDQLNEAQSRVKGLRLDNGLLRDQLRELKKTSKKGAGKNASDGATVSVSADGKPTNETLSPTAAVEMLTSQVKTLKRRVLQKQEVVVAHKTKISELDAEVVLLRTKLFDLSQAYRQQHQFQQQKEQSVMQGVTHLKEELEASVSRKAEQLDGLRASIFDACEVFVQCDPPDASTSASHRPPRSPASSTSSTSSLWPEDEDDGGVEKKGRVADELLLELRQYADLSPGDLADLHIRETHTKSRASKSSTRKATQRQQDLYTRQRTQKQGQQLLMDLEHALEVTPQDCRTEICDVLEFLCSKRVHSASARRY